MTAWICCVGRDLAALGRAMNVTERLVVRRCRGAGNGGCGSARPERAVRDLREGLDGVTTGGRLLGSDLAHKAISLAPGAVIAARSVFP